MSSSDKVSCPYCVSCVVPHYLFKHLLNQHSKLLYSDSINKQSLNFGVERKSLPRIRLPNAEYKSVCYKCECMITRDAFAVKHLDCLADSKKIAAELLEKLVDVSGQTLPFVSSNNITTQESLAYKKVILNMLSDLEDALYWKAKYEMLLEDERVADVLRQMTDPDPDSVIYDIEGENPRSAKYVNLDRATILNAGKTKLL